MLVVIYVVSLFQLLILLVISVYGVTPVMLHYFPKYYCA
jgi:hypothetical protein